MKKMMETFRFIETMDVEINDLIGDFLSELFEELHESLLENPEYAACIKRRSELSRIIFKNNEELNTQYGDVTSQMEGMLEMGCFLLGIKMGKKLGLEIEKINC